MTSVETQFNEFGIKKTNTQIHHVGTGQVMDWALQVTADRWTYTELAYASASVLVLNPCNLTHYCVEEKFDLIIANVIRVVK